MKQYLLSIYQPDGEAPPPEVALPPPSTMMSMRPSRSASTWDARVGLGRENRFALGAATGRPARAISARAMGCEGTLIATVARPAVTSSGTRDDRRSTIVSGPGQKRTARARRTARR